MIPRVLVIAGSDSGGGAGIQADIKTITMLGGHAMTAITAVTAQNTIGVHAIHRVPTDIVIAQIEACLSDIGVDAVKIGMIGSAETAEAVASAMPRDLPIVFDPVMVATSGASLADATKVAAFDRLATIARVTTPNIPELEALGGEARLIGLNATLLIKGGHAGGAEIVDRLIGVDGEIARWSAPRIATPHTHGTGCTLASAIATRLAQGDTLTAAVEVARRFVRLAIRDAPGLGAGHGPMGHGQVRLDEGTGLRLNQVSIPASHPQATRDFYRTLGLRLIVDSADNGYLRFEAAGGATLSAYAGGEGVYFECDDVDGEVARLQAAGVTFDELLTDRGWLWRQAWLRDPAGNRLCLYHAGENRRYPPWRV